MSDYWNTRLEERLTACTTSLWWQILSVVLAAFLGLMLGRPPLLDGARGK